MNSKYYEIFKELKTMCLQITIKISCKQSQPNACSSQQRSPMPDSNEIDTTNKNCHKTIQTISKFRKILGQ